jgi:hypothetical protein
MKSIIKTNEYLNIGWVENAYSSYAHFKGAIDEVRIYNRALSPEEIQQLYTGTTTQEDTQPDSFRFTDQTNLSPNQAITSNPVTITGIDAPAPVSVTNGAYAVNGGGFTSQPGTVNNGDSVTVRVNTSSQYATETSATLTVGGVSDTFSASTRTLDVTPDAFRFTSREGIPLQQPVVSEPVAITGLEAKASIRISNGEYALNGGPFTNKPGTINNGDAVQVRVTAARDYNTPVTATLTVGTVSGSFTVTTQTALPPDTVPDAFNLEDRNGVAVNSIVLSNPVAITGINLPTPIAISGGFYAVNGGAFINQPGTVNAGDSVQVRLFAAGQLATPVTARLDVGGVSDDFIVTTEAPAVIATDTIPDPFKFNNQTGVEPGLTVTSNPVAITGINAPAPVNISEGVYAINGGAYTREPGTVSNGDVVQVQAVAGAAGRTTAARLTVGGVEAAFTVMARTASSNPVVSGTVDWSRSVRQVERLLPAISGGVSYGQSLLARDERVWISAPDATSQGQKQRGIVYGWQRQGDGSYRETGPALSNGRAGDRFGTRLLGVEDTLLIAAPGYDRDSLKDIGRVYVYPETGNAPSQILEAPEFFARAGFGQTLASHGDWLAVAAPGVAKDSGRVYLYARDNGEWMLKQTLRAPDAGSRFGTSLALNGDWLMVGAPQARPAGLKLRSGMVYAYRLSGNQWKPAASEALPLPTEDQYRAGDLGAMLTLTDTTLAVAAPRVNLKDDGGRIRSESGRIYTWSLDGVSQHWQIEATLEMDVPYLANAGSRFGSTLSLSADGRWLVAGAPGADQNLNLDGDNQFDIGRVFVYRVGGLGWTLTQMLKGETRFLRLGQTVLLTPDTLFISDGKGGVGAYQVE